jgi:uncharacterized protein YwbE
MGVGVRKPRKKKNNRKDKRNGWDVHVVSRPNQQQARITTGKIMQIRTAAAGQGET